MDFVANLAVFEGAARSVANWRPGTVRVDDDGLAFQQRGEDALDQLAFGDIESVSISSHVIGADDVYVALKTGGTWSLRVSGGEKLVEALRERGVQTKR